MRSGVWGALKSLLTLACLDWQHGQASCWKLNGKQALTAAVSWMSQSALPLILCVASLTSAWGVVTLATRMASVSAMPRLFSFFR